ncbi:MAG: carboxypeptidase regulatory-like domain-containing protein [Planctomycetes bacterium]|nr:carboxypeptidase regulatory-like domain-containing protein [Planctomycetota bacterium]
MTRAALLALLLGATAFAGSGESYSAEVVDPGGLPFPEKSILASWSFGSGAELPVVAEVEGSQLVPSDAHGRICFCMPDPAAHHRSGHLLLRFLHRRDPKVPLRNLRGSFVARIALEDLRGASGRDLGRVVLHPAPLLVAGRTVDSRGNGVPQASLAIETPTGELVFGESDANGGFEICAFPEELPRELRLVARCAGYVQREVPAFPVGLSCLHVILRKGGGFDLRLASAAGEPWPELHLQLAPYGGAGRVLDEPTREGAGLYRWHDVPPGRYRVRIADAATKLVLFESPLLAIPAGAVTRDARLHPLELREHALRVHVRLLDEQGRPIDAGELRFHELPGFRKLPFVRGELSLALPRGQRVAATIVAPGFRPEIAELDAEQEALTLRRALRLRVVIHGVPAERAKEAVSKKFRLHPDPDDASARAVALGLAIELPSAALGEPFEIELPGPGRYLLETNGSFRGPDDVVPPGARPLPPTTADAAARRRTAYQRWSIDAAEPEPPSAELPTVELEWRG